MLHFKIEKKTDKKIVEYFGNLEKELLEGKLSWLLENLSCPVRFLFPSYEQIRLRMSASKSTVEKLGFENKIMDINGNSKDAGKDFDLRQKYGIWLMNIVRNTVINMILTAVNIKQLTYSKLRKWFLKNTCFGIQLEYTRSGQVVTTTWFSQIDYGVESLINSIIVFCKENQLIGGCLWIFFPYVLKAFCVIWLVIMEVVLQKYDEITVLLRHYLMIY